MRFACTLAAFHHYNNCLSNCHKILPFKVKSSTNCQTHYVLLCCTVMQFYSKIVLGASWERRRENYFSLSPCFLLLYILDCSNQHLFPLLGGFWLLCQNLPTKSAVSTKELARVKNSVCHKHPSPPCHVIAYAYRIYWNPRRPE